MKKISLFFSTLFGVSIFIICTICVLYIFQIRYLDFYYEKNQIDSIKKVIKEYKNIPDDDIVSYLSDVSYENRFCLKYYTSDNELEFNTNSPFCLISKDIDLVNKKIDTLRNSNVDYVKVQDSNGDTSLLYVYTINDSEFMVFNSNLASLNTATRLLKSQMGYLLVIFIGFGIVLCLFLSRILTKPISKITNGAKELEKGNYDVKFSPSHIKELDDLANVLNVSAIEMNNNDELRRDLIANVSHDLKTPLTMIKAYAEKVKDLPYKNKSERDKDLDVIINESERLNDLVNDLLELSKLESEANLFKLEVYNLLDQIDDVMKRYDIIKEKGYEFIFDLPNYPVYIKADRARMDQVFYNLINNAIEHTGDDKRIYISVRPRNNYFTVSIKDTGKGIPKEEKILVWNKYYTNKRNHKRNTVGTGLGLSIVKKIFEVHRFEYGIDSKEGEFTTFYFRFRKAK